MSRDSGSGDPSQRTVAELLAEHGGGSQSGARRRRRRAEDPTETAPQAIIDRVNSDSGRMRPVVDAEPPAAAQPAPAAEAPAPQAPAQPVEPQQARPPQHPVTGSRRQVEPPAETAHPPGGANFWARRFAAASGPAPAAPTSGRQPDPEANGSAQDPDATAQQPVVAPGAETRHPAPPSGPGVEQAVDGVTEQFPQVDNDASAGGPVPDDPGETGTAFLPYSPEVGPPGPAGPGGTDAAYGNDPYGSAYYDDHGDAGDYGAVTDYADGYGVDGYGADGYGADSYGVDSYREDSYGGDSYGDDSYGDDSYGDDPYAVDDTDDEYASPDDGRLPAGLGSEDYAGNFSDEEEPARSSAKEWLVLGAQVGAGLLAGGLVWVGFQWLWTAIPVAALVAALVVTGALVLVARKILRTDDLQTILLAVLVGLVCTVSPAALLLVGY